MSHDDMSDQAYDAYHFGPVACAQRRRDCDEQAQREITDRQARIAERANNPWPDYDRHDQARFARIREPIHQKRGAIPLSILLVCCLSAAIGFSFSI
jgi:hypothetical protein